MSTVDRLALIAAAAEKVQGRNTFKAKVQAKGRKAVKNATAGRRSEKLVEAFDESSMYDEEKAVRKIWNDSGVVDSYRDTVRFDNEWN